MATSQDGAFRTAIITITKHGVQHGARLHRDLPDSDHFTMAKFAGEVEGVVGFSQSVRQFLGECFQGYDGLVVFISLGAVVRMIADQLNDKKVDPAVVVVDDRANFAIAVLSGHLGGANALTRRVAAILGATPVITTASDVSGTIAVDLLGREFGWEVASWEHATPVSAAVVNEEPVGFYQDAGEPNWWPADKPLPKNIHLFHDLDALAVAQIKAALIVTDRVLGPEYGDLLAKAVVYRPKTLVVGVGCMRNTPCAEIEAAVLGALEGAALALKSIRGLATITVKQDEAGITELARKLRAPVAYFTQDELNAAVGTTHVSEAAMKHVGAVGVCEPAALLGADALVLTVSKVVSGRVTVAVARKRFTTETTEHTE